MNIEATKKPIIDFDGQKFNMDGGADGHNEQSARDEFRHNPIDDSLMVNTLHEFDVTDKFYGVVFDVNSIIDDPSKKLDDICTLYATKGKGNSISKYGKGIRFASHCISPNGIMYAFLQYDGILNAVMWDMKNLSVMGTGENGSKELVDLFQPFKSEILKRCEIDDTKNCGFTLVNIDRMVHEDFFKLIIDSMDKMKNNEHITKYCNKEHLRACNNKSSYDVAQLKDLLLLRENSTESTDDTDNLQVHKDPFYNTYMNVIHNGISYAPLLQVNDKSIRNIKMFSNTCPIVEMLPTCRFPSDNVDIDELLESNQDGIFLKSYRVQTYSLKESLKYVSFEPIYGGEVYGDKFVMTSNKSTIDVFAKPINLKSSIWKVSKCIIHFSELSLSTNKQDSLITNKKTEKVCIKVYRNGVSSDKSTIPLHGRDSSGKTCGFRPTDAPGIRGELICNAEFDDIIRPGSNKSNIVVENLLVEQLQMLANYIRNKKFIKSSYQERNIEGSKYHLHNNKVSIVKDSVSIGNHGGKKSSRPKWENMPSFSGLKGKDSKLNEQNNRTPFTKEYIENSDSVKWAGAVQSDFKFCLFLIDPNSKNSKSIIISQTEYEMIEQEIITKEDLINEEKSREYLEKEINVLLDRVNGSNMSALHNEINVRKVTVIN